MVLACENNDVGIETLDFKSNFISENNKKIILKVYIIDSLEKQRNMSTHFYNTIINIELYVFSGS